MIAARALFAFHHGDDVKPTERQLIGGMLESEKIDALRILSRIEVARVKAEAKAARKPKTKRK